MRITGKLHSIGHHQILTDGNPNDDETIEDCLERFTGILITAGDDTLRAAVGLLYATVDIYPHPVDVLAPGQCTPENYAHALARLAHAEDHLAREVRSSQAILAKQKEQERKLSIYRTKYHEASTALSALDSQCAKHPPGITEAHALIDKLRAEVREYEAAAEDVFDHAMANAPIGEVTAIPMGDAEASLVVELRAQVAERDRTIVNMQGTINELVRQADVLRQQVSDVAMARGECIHDALARIDEEHDNDDHKSNCRDPKCRGCG